MNEYVILYSAQLEKTSRALKSLLVLSAKTFSIIVPSVWRRTVNLPNFSALWWCVFAAWNTLLHELRAVAAIVSFKHHLKNVLFSHWLQFMLFTHSYTDIVMQPLFSVVVNGEQ